MHAKETTITADTVDPMTGNQNISVNNNGEDNAQHGSLFVGDLSIFCTEADMQESFQPFGEIVEVKVMRCDETHKNLCYGFVKFSNQEDAQRAMDSLNSALLCGRPMRYIPMTICPLCREKKIAHGCQSVVESVGRLTKLEENWAVRTTLQQQRISL